MIRGSFRYKSEFLFESGEKLDELEIVYHHTGDYSPSRRVIWICHALTANSNPEEWWDGLVGPGKLFDTREYYIICANMIGSCYGSERSGVSRTRRGTIHALIPASYCERYSKCTQPAEAGTGN